MARRSSSKKNALAHAQSPYLLQHANNPVDWFPWEETALKKAQKEDKLLIISIGYAACHWCHVMEHESFEDEAVATLMNSHFVSIKVDREERPDIDQVYMQALQMLTGQGGWPLNMIALPDGRPVWGGTYFPKAQWMDYLTQIVTLKQKEPKRLLQYATHLEKGMQQLELKKSKDVLAFDHKALDKALGRLDSKLDRENGGLLGAPKFMMPTLIDLFLSNDQFKKHAHFTLEKMALGGIFDLVGGGFSRYSVDEKWHIPHFEKMGYDNGQLLYSYSCAYQDQPKAIYKEAVDKTISFLQRDLSNVQGGFYAALDADSLDRQEILTEGAFYVWTLPELEELGLLNQAFFKAYFGINQNGYWEKDQYVLYRKQSPLDFIQNNNLPESFKDKIVAWEETLFRHRIKRSPARLDNKIICSWNAIIGRGILKAANVFQNTSYLQLVKAHLLFVEKTFHKKEGGLYRLNKKMAAPVHGFLEDYCHLIAYYLDAYETFFDPSFLDKASALIHYCKERFNAQETALFVFAEEEKLILQTKEVNDNVIPSSNAIMAENLIRASIHLGEINWHEQAKEMIALVAKEMLDYPRAYSTWLRLALSLQEPHIEIVVVGPKAIEWIKDLKRSYLKVNHWAASITASEAPLFKGRYQAGKTLIYLCKNNQCNLPYTSLEEFKTREKPNSI